MRWSTSRVIVTTPILIPCIAREALWYYLLVHLDAWSDEVFNCPILSVTLLILSIDETMTSLEIGVSRPSVVYGWDRSQGGSIGWLPIPPPGLPLPAPKISAPHAHRWAAVRDHWISPIRVQESEDRTDTCPSSNSPASSHNPSTDASPVTVYLPTTTNMSNSCATSTERSHSIASSTLTAPLPS